MKSCPYCKSEPDWYFCRNTSFARGANHFAFTGCKHAETFHGAAFIATPDVDRPAYEAKWDAHAEGLFAAYTARWTDAQRASFRARLWAVRAPVAPAAPFVREVGVIEATAAAFRHAVEASDDCPWDDKA